jgi:hypothetical protein
MYPAGVVGISCSEFRAGQDASQKHYYEFRPGQVRYGRKVKEAQEWNWDRGCNLTCPLDFPPSAEAKYAK